MSIYFYTHFSLKPDSEITLYLTLEGKEKPIEIEGRIMRYAKLHGNREAIFSGTGVSITKISEEDHKDIKDFLSNQAFKMGLTEKAR